MIYFGECDFSVFYNGCSLFMFYNVDLFVDIKMVFFVGDVFVDFV